MGDHQDINAKDFNKLLDKMTDHRYWHVRLPGRRHQIHRVSGELRSQNEHVFNPALVSLGPYHHGKEELSRGERFKYICLKSCSGGDEGRKVLLYNLIHRNIAEIRSCYADHNWFKDWELAMMMLLDACFILSFMVNSLIWPDPNNNNNNIPVDNNIPIRYGNNNIRDWVDFLGLASIQHATSDILLLENQVPFLVITLLLDSLYDEVMRARLLASFFHWTVSVDRLNMQVMIPGAAQEPPIHLLEACWRVLVMREDNIAPIQPPLTVLTYLPQIFYTNCSAACLKAMGIQIHTSDSQSIRDIEFNEGRLYIPIKDVSPLTTVVYSNLIAYEVSPSTRTEPVVLCYVNLLKSLIQTPEDVKELQRNHTLVNSFAYDEQALQAFKEISTFGLARFDTFRDVRLGIDRHCEKMWKTILVNLYFTHFQTPLSATGFFTAVFLLGLALLLTTFTISPKK